MDPGTLSKRVLKEAFEHFGAVAYVDLHNKIVQQVTLRFKTQTLLLSFLAKAASDCEAQDAEGL